MNTRKTENTRNQRSNQSGFTLAELAIATAVLLFGVVAVMQLVPMALRTNTTNRYDTTAVVVAQRLLDEMTAQPLTNANVTDPVCGVMSLGAGAAGVTVESPNATYLVMFNGSATVDFTQAAAAGYSCDYTDPNNVYGGDYLVRWGVVVTENAGGQPVAKRFVVGVKRNAPQFRFPINIDSTVQR